LFRRSLASAGSSCEFGELQVELPGKHLYKVLNNKAHTKPHFKSRISGRRHHCRTTILSGETPSVFNRLTLSSIPTKDVIINFFPVGIAVFDGQYSETMKTFAVKVIIDIFYFQGHLKSKVIKISATSPVP
jgi:hypothetical protein